jgi:hypothetical protein
MSQMPVNKKEKLVYTYLMVLFMCFGMVSYNVVLNNGFNFESLKLAWLTFAIMMPIAFVVEWFIVSKIATKLIEKFVKPTDALPKVILISALCFVVQMVLIMSFVANLIYGDTTQSFLMNWLISIPKNFIVAFPLQVLLAGPIIGFVFRKLFPLGTIQHIESK